MISLSFLDFLTREAREWTDFSLQRFNDSARYIHVHLYEILINID